MATSKSFFGMRRGKAGAFVYSILNGRQITRAIAEYVTNPQTASQMYQRIKLAPASLFYNAFNNVLNHSWEGIKYGRLSRQKFLSYALGTDNVIPFVIKNYKTPVAGNYQVSSGTLGEVRTQLESYTVGTGEDATTDLGLMVSGINIYSIPTETPANVRSWFMQMLLDNNEGVIQENDKLTFLFVHKNLGCITKQIIVNPSTSILDDFSFLQDNNDWILLLQDSEQWAATNGRIFFDPALIDGGAVIISRGELPDAKRSTSFMGVSQDVINRFFTDAALQVSIQSYTTADTVLLQDDWYLNYAVNGLYGRITQTAVRLTDGQIFIYISLVVDVAGIYDVRVIVQTREVNGQPVADVLMSANGEELEKADGTPLTLSDIGYTGKTVDWDYSMTKLL